MNLPYIISLDHIGHALSAIACASELGVDLLLAINEVAKHKLPPGRLNLIMGVHNSIIIDDTYNSSPFAMEAALRILKDIEGKRKIAVLGDMLELGKLTDEEHKIVGENASYVADIIVTVGPRAKNIGEGALSKGFPVKNLYNFDSSKTTASFLEGIVEEGDIVLVKGSQGVRLERAVEAIMADKSSASHLLCRQEKEWKNR